MYIYIENLILLCTISIPPCRNSYFILLYNLNFCHSLQVKGELSADIITFKYMHFEPTLSQPQCSDGGHAAGYKIKRRSKSAFSPMVEEVEDDQKQDLISIIDYQLKIFVSVVCLYELAVYGVS